MAAHVCAVLLLGIFATTHAFVDEAVDVILLSKHIGEEVLNSWDIIGKPFNASQGVELPFIHKRERQLFSRLSEITRAIKKLEAEVEKSRVVAILLEKNLGRGPRLELKLNEMSDLLSRVDSADREMREYVRLQRELERRTLEDFASWCVAHDRGALPGLLERVHALVVPPHTHLLGHSLLDLVANDLQERHPDVCELQLSPHQLIYDMYNTIALTEIKGYAMMQFSWMLLRIYGKGNFTQEASLTRDRYTVRMIRTAEAAKGALAMAQRDLYRCDPPQHVKGETYEEVTRLLQGYIENEVDMNQDKTCKENCAYYTLSKNYDCSYDMYCSKQPTCKGRIINCQYVDSDMWVCPASETSTRRYEWIEYENERKLGRMGYCKRGTTKVDSWWRFPFHCSYCFCLCEDEVSVAERTFSMREATSNIDLNNVVTGLRLVKHGRVFHLQVSEGRLGERGAVTPGTWVPFNKFDVNDPDVREGVDYHTLSYERRAFDLDELDSPYGHIMTGVRFRMIGAHLHFEIRSTRFNYSTGRLAPERSQWISNDNTDGAEVPRSRLSLIKPDIPIYSNSMLPVDSKHDQYIEFTNSDLDADAAQSTVPFIDIQPVQPLKGASLISGAGMIHRGTRGSGGFIAPKLFTYDYSRHVKAELPPDTDGETPDFMPVAAN